jgi:hypothetical protein
MRRQVWFNLNDGTFGNPWDPNEYAGNEVYDKVMKEQMAEANERGWKLIEYECLNDSKFDFYSMMKIVSNV